MNVYMRNTSGCCNLWPSTFTDLWFIVVFHFTLGFMHRMIVDTLTEYFGYISCFLLQKRPGCSLENRN
jgi:hypothetical protein